MTVKLSKSKVYRSKEPVKIGLNELSEQEKTQLGLLDLTNGDEVKSNVDGHEKEEFNNDNIH